MCSPSVPKKEEKKPEDDLRILLSRDAYDKSGSQNYGIPGTSGVRGGGGLLDPTHDSQKVIQGGLAIGI